MKKIKTLGIVAILSLLCIGCGKSVEEKIAGDWMLFGKLNTASSVTLK